MPFSALVNFFCLFYLLHISKMVPFEDIFHSGKQKNIAQGKIEWIGRMGHGVMLFLVKNCWTLSEVWAGMLANHPPWNEQTHWKILQNKFTEAEYSLSQQCQLVHWYRWVPRTFSYWGEPIIQGTRTPKDNSGFWGSPLYICRGFSFRHSLGVLEHNCT